MSSQKVLGNVTDGDVSEIERISRKQSIKKLSDTLLKDLNRELLSRMISAYMVLKANGHTDADVAKYLTTKESKKVLELGFGAGRRVATFTLDERRISLTFDEY